MRQVQWIEEGAVGDKDRPARGTVAELLVGGPYPNLSPPEVPPLVVVNELLARPGGSGMNGGRRWKPFTIDDTDYQELVHDLVRAHGFELVDVPGWVTCGEDWHAWLLERRWGVPAQPHRLLRERARELARQLEHAQQDPNAPRDRLAELFLAAKRADDDADHFGDPWLTMPQYAKYRRTFRWMQDARHRNRAAEMAGDEAGAGEAAAEVDRLGERCREARRDEQWPAEWEDWPDYPPASIGRSGSSGVATHSCQ